MVRVLQVVTKMDRGGLETMLMNYYRHIDRDKVQFDFLTHRKERGAYDTEIEEMGGIIYRLPRLVPWSRSYKHALNQFFVEHPEYRIIHVHQDCLSSVILKVAEQHGVPVRIAHSHSSSQDKNIKYLIKIFYKRQIPQYATELFACSVNAGEWMFGTQNIHVLPNAIDIRQYTFNTSVRADMRKKLGIGKELVIGHVGRFSKVKNQSFLVDVFEQIKQQEPNSKLLMVGEGEELETIQHKCNSLGLDQDVIFTGVRNDVAALMQAMDIFIFPSLYEGVPVTMLEAQASGLPCIISDRVPGDCIVTTLVQQISLKESILIWASKAIIAAKYPRKDTRKEISIAGFDIYQAAKNLEQYYELKMR